MTLYYLDIPVEPTDDANVRGLLAVNFSPGHVNARWPDGKVYTHWRAQLTLRPWLALRPPWGQS